MNFLEEKIISDGVIKEGNSLKVDNFLNHQIDIDKQAGADIIGLGVALEKGQQRGGKFLREAGYHLESIAIINDMDFETQTIHFRDNR